VVCIDDSKEQGTRCHSCQAYGSRGEDPEHLAILALLENTQDHFAKCLEDTESIVSLHVEDIKALMGHCMALAKRVRVLEERLGIAEQAEIPGD